MGCGPSVGDASGNGGVAPSNSAKFDAAAEPRTSAFKKRMGDSSGGGGSPPSAASSAKKVSFLVEGAAGLHPVVPGEGDDDPPDRDDPNGINRIDHSVPPFVPLGHIDENSVAEDELPTEPAPPNGDEGDQAVGEGRRRGSDHSGGSLHSPMQPNETSFGRTSPAPQPRPRSPSPLPPPLPPTDVETHPSAEPDGEELEDPVAAVWHKTAAQLSSPPPKSMLSDHFHPRHGEGSEHHPEVGGHRRVSFSDEC